MSIAWEQTTEAAQHEREVLRLRELIQRGAYEVPAVLVAEAMLQRAAIVRKEATK